MVRARRASGARPEGRVDGIAKVSAQGRTVYHRVLPRRPGTPRMIRSMTAYANTETTTPQGWLACELRGVNSRFLETGVRLPDELRTLEPAVRERIGVRLARGKVDATFRYRAPVSATDLLLDERTADQLAAVARALKSNFPQLATDFASLLDWPGLLVKPEFDQAGLVQAALALLDRTLDELVAGREREGSKLAVALRERLDGIERIIADVRATLPEIRAALRAKLETKLAELKQAADPGRLEQELVLQLSRIDVDEELDRLDAHVGEARRILTLDEPVGRRLDFLMQEFNREANTLASKSVDSRSTRAAVDLKVLIEQMREQVQNLECAAGARARDRPVDLAHHARAASGRCRRRAIPLRRSRQVRGDGGAWRLPGTRGRVRQWLRHLARRGGTHPRDRP